GSLARVTSLILIAPSAGTFRESPRGCVTRLSARVRRRHGRARLPPTLVESSRKSTAPCLPSPEGATVDSQGCEPLEASRLFIQALEGRWTPACGGHMTFEKPDALSGLIR